MRASGCLVGSSKLLCLLTPWPVARLVIEHYCSVPGSLMHLSPACAVPAKKGRLGCRIAKQVSEFYREIEQLNSIGMLRKYLGKVRDLRIFSLHKRRSITSALALSKVKPVSRYVANAPASRCCTSILALLGKAAAPGCLKHLAYMHV